MALSSLSQMGKQQDALRGLSSLYVSVDSLDKTVVTDEQLRVQIELRLRRAGILVKQCATDTLCLPQIYVKVVPIPTGDRTMFCLIRMEGNIAVSPVGEPNRRLMATAWLTESSILALKNEYRPVTDEIDRMVDALANDYLAANPKPRQ